ncbi:hypothetical protein MKX01_020145 [Papaver californicum]|nr:hypothetical protein MKX01_020145 [Papaver californicum]
MMLAGLRSLLKFNNNNKNLGLCVSSSVGGGISTSCYHYLNNRTFSSSSSVREGCDDGVGGYVMSFGDGNQGALGLPSSSMGIGAGGGGDAYEPTKITGLPSDDITCIGAGHYHSLAVTSHGDVWSWGRNKMNFNSAGLHLLFQGTTSSLEVTEKLVLEQMQKENDMPIIWEPCLLQELNGVKVSDVACGLDHSLVLCCNGVLLSGGNNTYGQLGRGKEESLGLSPVDMSFQPLTISSGLGHSLAVCQQISSSQEVMGGDVSGTGIASWGWNGNFQLGRSGPKNVPKLVKGLEEETPLLVSGGRVHSVALTSKGEVWVCGCGKIGRLGLGSSIDEVEPVLIEDLEAVKVLQVASGFDHNLLLVVNR